VVEQKHLLLQQLHQHANQVVVENRLHLPILRTMHQLMKHRHPHHRNVQNDKQQPLLMMLLLLAMKQIQLMMFNNQKSVAVRLKVKQLLHHHQVENVLQQRQLQLLRKKREVKILSHQPMMRILKKLLLKVNPFKLHHRKKHEQVQLKRRLNHPVKNMHENYDQENNF
jgi:hypothetical protein